MFTQLLGTAATVYGVLAAPKPLPARCNREKESVHVQPRCTRRNRCEQWRPAAPKPVQIAFVLYPGFTALDIIGPFRVLAFVRGHEAMFVAAEAGPVTDDTGRCQLTASVSFGQVTSPDVVVIGGTLFNGEPDQRVVQWLRQVHPTTSWTTSVCTGSIYLAAAGILDGQQATSHWAWPESWNAAASPTPSSGWWNAAR